MAQLTTARAPFFIQESPAEKRKAALANAMMGNALQYNPNYRSALGPLAQTLAGAMGGYMMNKANEAYGARRDAATQNMQDALSVYNQAREVGNPNAYRDMIDQMSNE